MWICLNCDQRKCIDFWLVQEINKFLPIQVACIDFSEWPNNENGYYFCKGLELESFR